MRKFKAYIYSLLAVLAAIAVSIFLIEQSIIILSCLFVTLVTIIAAAVRCSTAKCSRFRALTKTTIPAILYIAIALSHIPLRITFRIYRSEFDQVAAQIQNGKPPETPFWIGPFKIKMTGVHENSKMPYLASNTDKLEINGFVRHPEGQGFNLWSCIELDDSWSYISED